MSLDRLSFSTICFALFLRGIDYGVVMPSMWRFLQTLDSDISELFFGITIASFSASSMFFSPFFGAWFDRRPMKEVLLALTIISAAGSMLYGLSLNIWMVLGGRIISGIGSLQWTGASLYVIRTTTTTERSGLFAVINMIFIVALAAGPAINFPMTKLPSYAFGPFKFSQLSCPGYLMAVGYVISFLTVVFLFKEPIVIKESEKLVNKSKAKWWEEWKQIFMSFPCVVVIIFNLLSVYVQTTLEALVTPLTQEWYNFSTFWNSILYAGLTVVMIVWFIGIGLIASRVQDRTFLLCGHLLYALASGLFLYFLIKSHKKNLEVPIWQFCFVCAAYASAIPLYKSTINSLFSKLLNNNSLDGRGQSVMTSASSLGAILGPLSSGFFLAFDLHWLLVTAAALWAIVFLMMIFAWSDMYIVKTKVIQEDEENVYEQNGKKKMLVN